MLFHLNLLAFLEYESKSAIAITAYLPLVVSFINYRCITTILVKFLSYLVRIKKNYLTHKNVLYKQFIFFEIIIIINNETKSSEIFIPGPAGRLEAKYYKNPKFGSPVAIVLQPHPQYGGTMNNKIVQLMYNIFLRMVSQ